MPTAAPSAASAAAAASGAIRAAIRGDMSEDVEAGARLLSPRRRPPRAPRAAGRQRILCYDRRYFCRVALWLELMVGIIMTILGLFILLLSIESLKEDDYPAVYFCSSFIALGVLLLLVYYVHYYALKFSIKRQLQRLDHTIRSDQDALAALAKRSLQLSKIAVPRKDPPGLLADDGGVQLPQLAGNSNCAGPAALQPPASPPLPPPPPPQQLRYPQPQPNRIEEAALVVPAYLGAALPQSFSDFDLWDARQSDV